MNALMRLFDGALPQLVMFDLDGTLVDSVPDLAAAVDHMLALRGRPPAGVERVRDWVGNGALVLVRRALAGSLAHDGVGEAEARAALDDFFEAYSGDHSATAVYPGVMPFRLVARAWRGTGSDNQQARAVCGPDSRGKGAGGFRLDHRRRHPAGEKAGSGRPAACDAGRWRRSRSQPVYR